MKTKNLKHRLARPITPEMAIRIRELVDACSTCQEHDRLTLYPGSTATGGKPFKNLTHELDMLLHGYTPHSRCKLPAPKKSFK